MRLHFFFFLLLPALISCKKESGTNLELQIIREEEPISDARVRFYIDSENKSKFAIDTLIYSNINGKVFLSMPGECYLNTVVVYQVNNTTYAGSKVIHLVDEQTTLDTVYIH